MINGTNSAVNFIAPDGRDDQPVRAAAERWAGAPDFGGADADARLLAEAWLAEHSPTKRQCIPVKSYLPPEYLTDDCNAFKQALRSQIQARIETVQCDTDRGPQSWSESLISADDILLDVTECNHLPASVYWQQDGVHLVAWLKSVKTKRFDEVVGNVHVGSFRRIARYFVVIDHMEGASERIDFSDLSNQQEPGVGLQDAVGVEAR